MYVHLLYHDLSFTQLFESVVQYWHWTHPACNFIFGVEVALLGNDEQKVYLRLINRMIYQNGSVYTGHTNPTNGSEF